MALLVLFAALSTAQQHTEDDIFRRLQVIASANAACSDPMWHAPALACPAAACGRACFNSCLSQLNAES
jgi:hypothetical protein